MNLSAVRGVTRLARFDSSGLAGFDASPQGLLNALAPWIAFSLVACVIMLVRGQPAQALGDALVSVVALLTPPVTSHALASFWKRKPNWLRYAVAVVWCQWVMPVALLVALTGSFVMMGAGVPERTAERIVMLALLVYALALNIFLARRALDMAWWKAVLLVLAVNFVTGTAVLAPRLIEIAQELGA